MLGRTIWGVLGIGAFGFELTEAPAGKHIIVTTRSHGSTLVNDCISALNPDSVIRVGGAGNKVRKLLIFCFYWEMVPLEGEKKKIFFFFQEIICLLA